MHSSRKEFLKRMAILGGVGLLPAKKIFADIGQPLLKKTLDTYHPKDCSWNLKTTDIYNDLATQTGASIFSYAKSNLSIDVQYADENTTGLLECKLGAKCDYLDGNNMDSLRYKAYYPLWSVHDYTNKPLPVIILFHGGAYSDCLGDFDSLTNQMGILAQTFCAKGFIAISVEYRRGRIYDNFSISGRPQGYTSAQMELAGYRAQQDGRGAIRSIMRRNREDQHGSRFIIDTSQVFIGGFSAGAGIANGIAYYGNNQTVINQVFPKKSGSSYPSVETKLGPILADYYYGGVSETFPTIKGLLNCWGGLAIPTDKLYNKSDFFNSTALVPMIAFQGSMDEVVFFDNFTKQYIYFSSESHPEFATENYCTIQTNPNSFVVNSTSLTGTPPFIILCTLDIHCYLQSQNIYTEQYVDTSMGHGIVDSDDNFGITVGSDFLKDVTKYIAQRGACFFQSIMNGPNTVPYGYTGRAKFLNCENSRASCSLTDNNACTSELGCN